MNMKVFALVIQLVVLYMVIPQASLFFGDVMKAVDDVVKGLCKAKWDWVCTPSWLLKRKCSWKKYQRCKRSTDIDVEGVVEYALPDEFYIYDMNRDGLIEYEEFIFTLMSLAPMEQPEEMRGPFLDSDIDKNGRIDRDEWEKAPLMLQHLTDEGLESLRVDILETDMPEKRGYGYWRGYGGYRRRRAAGFEQ